LQPYTLVKDVRTGEQTNQAAEVLDGALDRFLAAWCRRSG
jgi:peptide chain release factor 2